MTHIGHELEREHGIGVILRDGKDVDVVAPQVDERAGAQHAHRCSTGNMVRLLAVEDVCTKHCGQVAPAGARQERGLSTKTVQPALSVLSQRGIEANVTLWSCFRYNKLG